MRAGLWATTMIAFAAYALEFEWPFSFARTNTHSLRTGAMIWSTSTPKARSWAEKRRTSGCSMTRVKPSRLLWVKRYSSPNSLVGLAMKERARASAPGRSTRARISSIMAFQERDAGDLALAERVIGVRPSMPAMPFR
uniref:Putative secreted protein n=1 Tax=Anopheles darlingi TaxID=43151 RepID=A0A2M4D682_ANODA